MQLTKYEFAMLQDVVAASGHACSVCREVCDIRFAAGSSACPRVEALESLRTQVGEMGTTDTPRT